MAMPNIILSSSSIARRELLERLALPFQVITPNIDESPLPNELPPELVRRLAVEKAEVHQHQFPNSLIIGSDQVAFIGNEIIGKPTSHEHAAQILKSVSGQQIMFYTGLCLFNTETKRYQARVETYTVTYKNLSSAIIESYLRKEQPYHCAGSIKVEGLGIALLKELRGNDPSILTGLPLIALIEMLENEGVYIL